MPKGKKGKNKAAPAKKAPIDKTPEGKKKDVQSSPIPDAYYPSYVEAAWYEWWEKCGFFKPDFKHKDEVTDFKEKFIMVIPPPNVTGTLHLGHTLMCAIEDTITRWHRMQGKKTLWLPGTDHAGIATQSVVEKKLMREKKLRRQDLGREKFLEEVWKWKEQSGSHICRQLRRLGSSCDWSREAFTMDKQLNVAVKEAFCRMYNKGLIYRKARLVNWSCKLQTAISDIEVDKIDIEKPKMIKIPNHDKEVEFGVLHKFRYKMKGDSKRSIIVATTRIETMLGDVAVAVHPSDERYKDLVGKELEHPFIKDRKMKVITDDVLVDPKFGTGAVKITPAHDPNDFECGMRHKLVFINILNDDGTMNENAGPYKGMKRFEVRSKIIKDLKNLDLYEGKEVNKMVLGFCSRSGDVIEPIIRPQWWVDCTDMARRSVEAVDKGDLEILPKSHLSTWDFFMKNIQPWCISRQLWWGHRIPAYFITVEGYKPTESELLKAEREGYKVGSDADANFWVAARDEKEAQTLACSRFKDYDPASISLRQDDDVLDTWFSSGLFPFSTMGWPEETPDFKEFFPGHLLETGHDILFFWVARMVMMSLELTDKLPFKTVFLHAMVRDKLGRKMSKSRGNVVDPIHVMEGVSLQVLLDKIQKGNLAKAEHKTAMEAQKKDFPKGIPECGADALRYGLMTYMKQGKSINLDINVVVSCRHFCNKLWNATKFALSMFSKDFKVPNTSAWAVATKDEIKDESVGMSEVDKWILAKLYRATKDCNEGFEKWELANVADACRRFWLNEFCDYYLEMVKPIMYGKDSTEEQKVAVQRTLYICIDGGLRLLHPLMPFVTEELYQRIPGRDHSPEAFDSIMLARYPHPKASARWEDAQIEVLMEKAIKVIGEIRSLKARVGMQNKDKPPCYLYVQSTPNPNSNPSRSTCFSLFPTCMRDSAIETIESGADIGRLSEAIKAMANISDVKISSDQKKIPKGCLLAVCGEYEVSLPIEGFVDLPKLCVGYEKKMDDAVNQAADLKAKMSKPNYMTKTPEAIKQKNSSKLEGFNVSAKSYEESLKMFLGMMSVESRKRLHESKIATAKAGVAKSSADVKKLTDQIPAKEDPKYKKLMHKIEPKLKKAKMLLNKFQKRLATLEAMS